MACGGRLACRLCSSAIGRGSPLETSSFRVGGTARGKTRENFKFQDATALMRTRTFLIICIVAVRMLLHLYSAGCDVLWNIQCFLA